ncbi:MAG: type I-E CRISPR-associated protein Cse1/CasA [Myxococcales bacterium]|nr:type I-E CRISPR-associated protein Cse1/CasA [Myxococcales bacterium]
MKPFNLTREPWIPVETLDGTVVERSTRDALAEAHTLRGLADPSPLVVATLTRHLLAILHRAFNGPRDVIAWCEVAEPGFFLRAPIDAYLDTVEHRMDLFHPTEPFAQVRGLTARFREYACPIDELELVRSRWGGGRELFRHRPASPAPSMTPARAARALLAHHGFATGGLVKKPGEPTSATAAPLTRAGVVILRGDTLFKTLIANLLEYDPENALPFSTGGAPDRCAWEQPPAPRELNLAEEPKRVPLGYLDLLTWQSRRVELIAESGSVIAYINAVGQGLATGSPRDPMVTYHRHEKFGLLPVGIDVDRGFWREANALFESARGENAPFERPRALDLVSKSEVLEVLGRDTLFDVEVLGIAAEKSRVDAVRAERVQTLARCFNDSDARAAVDGALNLSRNLVSALRGALWVYARHALAPGGRDPDTNAVRGLVDSLGADTAAWSALGVVFEKLLRGLGDDPDAAAMRFEVDALRAVHAVFQSATARPETTARWLKARALAAKALDDNLKEHTTPRPQTQPAKEATP